MSMDFNNQNGDFTVSTRRWSQTLRLAIALGNWRPMGIQLNIERMRFLISELPQAEQAKLLSEAEQENLRPQVRTVDYVLNDGNIMLAQDAENLATALTSVLDDIPTFEIEEPANLFEYFSGPETRKWLKGLIAYLHNGGDVIIA